MKKNGTNESIPSQNIFYYNPNGSAKLPVDYFEDFFQTMSTLNSALMEKARQDAATPISTSPIRPSYPSKALLTTQNNHLSSANHIRDLQKIMIDLYRYQLQLFNKEDLKQETVAQVAQSVATTLSYLYATLTKVTNALSQDRLIIGIDSSTSHLGQCSIQSLFQPARNIIWHWKEQITSNTSILYENSKVLHQINSLTWQFYILVAARHEMNRCVYDLRSIEKMLDTQRRMIRNCMRTLNPRFDEVDEFMPKNDEANNSNNSNNSFGNACNFQPANNSINNGNHNEQNSQLGAANNTTNRTAPS